MLDTDTQAESGIFPQGQTGGKMSDLVVTEIDANAMAPVFGQEQNLV